MTVGYVCFRAIALFVLVGLAFGAPGRRERSDVHVLQVGGLSDQPAAVVTPDVPVLVDGRAAAVCRQRSLLRAVCPSSSLAGRKQEGGTHSRRSGRRRPRGSGGSPSVCCMSVSASVSGSGTLAARTSAPSKLARGMRAVVACAASSACSSPPLCSSVRVLVCEGGHTPHTCCYISASEDSAPPVRTAASAAVCWTARATRAVTVTGRDWLSSGTT